MVKVTDVELFWSPELPLTPMVKVCLGVSVLVMGWWLLPVPPGDVTACNQGQHEQPSDPSDSLSRAPSSGNGNGHTHNAEAGQPKSVSQWGPAGLPPSILHRGNRRGNGEFGTDDLSSGGNGTGHKGAAHADGQPGAGKRDGARERAGDGSDGDLRAG